MKYHRKFTNLHPRVLKTTQNFFNAHPFRGEKAERLALFRTWLRVTSQIYGVEVPELIYAPDSSLAQATSGMYNVPNQSITLPKLSVVTLFHEFRHHLQAQRGSRMTRANKEHDARAWSLSLFYNVKPRLFARSVRSGKIMYVKPEEI